MPKLPSRELTQFVLEKLPAESLTRQARLYRALAALAPTAAERANLAAQACECDALLEKHAAHAERHRQLVLDFKRGAS